MPWDQLIELDGTIAALELATAARSPWIAELAHRCLADRPGPEQGERA
jgi:hypothetical protein